MKYKFTFLLVFFVNFSCVSESSQNCLTIKVNPEYDSYKSIIINKDCIYIVGTEGSNMDHRTFNSIVYKAEIDSLNKNNNLLDIIIDGENRFYTIDSNYIYFLNRIYKEEFFNPENAENILFKFDPENQIISKIANFGNILVRNIFFKNDTIGYAFARLSNYAVDGALFITTNAWESWDTLKIKKSINKSYMKDNLLYFSTHINSFDTSWIFSINTDNFTFDSTQFHLRISDYHIENESEYWLLGVRNKKTILQHYKNNTIENIHTFSEDSMYFPSKLYKYNNFIAVQNGIIDLSLLGGFGATVPELHFSYDNGVTWEKSNQFDDAYYINPISFYKDERLAAYIGIGKIRICNFK